MGFHPVEEKKAGVPESTDPKGFSLVEDLKLADDLKGPALKPTDGYQELQLSKPLSSQEEKSPRRFGNLKLWLEEFKEPKGERAELKKRVAVRRNHPAQWSKADIRKARESWEFFRERFYIELEAEGFLKNVKRDWGEPGTFDPIDLKFSQDTVEKLNERVFLINGLLAAIILEVPDSAAGFELGKDKRLQWDRKSSLIRDKYGNIIILRHAESLDGKYFTGFKIVPPYFFSKDTTSQTKTIGVDLSRFGFGDHPKLLTIQSFPPIRTPDATNPYYIYSTLPPSDQETAERVYHTLKKLASEMESFFGFKPAEQIQNIFFAHSVGNIAWVRPANPDTFFVGEDITHYFGKGELDFLIPHEAFHCFDGQFEFSLHPSFVEIFILLRTTRDAEFFSAINEGNFFGRGNYGHSADTVFEFFATLTNSLRAPEWEKKVSEMPLHVRGLYYHALQRLKTALVAKRPEIVSAPVYQLLEERIASLEADGTTYPPLE